jgi:hypothetical protein
MKRLGLDMAFVRILLVSLPFSCGSRTFYEPAPAPTCGAARFVPIDWSQFPTDGGSGGLVDGDTPTYAQCANICGDTMTCNIAQNDLGVSGVECMTACSYGAGCGRRPEALPALHTFPPGLYGSGNPLGHYFEQAAYLEAASVYAFRRLAAELSAHHAPDALITAAKRAAHDEIRHARIMSRLAGRFAGMPRAPKKGPDHVRPLYEVALENAVEGCVCETHGALVAWVQAVRAQDPQLKRVFHTIAIEETEHARLAYAVAEFLHPSLTSAERRRIADAQFAAAVQLAKEAEIDPPAALVQLAGLPPQKTASRLVSQAQRTLFWPAA